MGPQAGPLGFSPSFILLPRVLWASAQESPNNLLKYLPKNKPAHKCHGGPRGFPQGLPTQSKETRSFGCSPVFLWGHEQALPSVLTTYSPGASSDFPLSEPVQKPPTLPPLHPSTCKCALREWAPSSWPMTKWGLQQSLASFPCEAKQLPWSPASIRGQEGRIQGSFPEFLRFCTKMQGVLFAFFSVLFCFLSKNSHETIVSSHCLFPVLLGLAEMLGPHSAAVSNSHPQKAQVALGQALPHWARQKEQTLGKRVTVRHLLGNQVSILHGPAQRYLVPPFPQWQYLAPHPQLSSPFK